MTSDLSIPHVSWDEIETFRQHHFSPEAQLTFFKHFTPCTASTTNEPTNSASTNTSAQHKEEDAWEYYDNMDYAYAEEEVEEQEEDLGYYPDGVKRTLTDAQIAIFRHSEIQEMLKAKRRELLAAEAAAAEKAEAEAAALEMEEEGRANITEDYSTHDRSSRPAPFTRQVDTGALPWDDEDVGAWEDNQHQQQQDSLTTQQGNGKGNAKGKNTPAAVVKKPMVKPTYDAPSGKQFFWPVIEK